MSESGNLSRRTFLRMAGLAAAGTLAVACAPTTPVTTGETPMAEAPSGDKITLRMWSHQNQSFIGANEKLVVKYTEQNPNVEIKYENFPYEDFITTIQTSMAAKSEADVMEMFGSWVQSYAKGGTLAVVDESVLTMAKGQELFYAAPLDGYVWEGKLYGLPNEYNLEVGGVLANKTKFDEAGLKYPPTWGSWDELVADAKKLTKTQDDLMTVAGFDYVTNDGLGFLFWEGILEKGAEYFANDGIHLDLLTPQAKETVQWMYDMANVDKVVDPNTFNADVNSVSTSFFQGLVGIGYIGPWIVPEGRRQFPDFKDEWDHVESPHFGAERKFAADAGWGKVVSPNTKSIQDAWKFAAFMTMDAANHREWNVATGTVPALKSVAADPTLLNDINWLGPSLKVLPFGRYVGNLQDRDYIWYNVVADHITECMQGQRSVDETMQLMHDEANAQIDSKINV